MKKLIKIFSMSLITLVLFSSIVFAADWSSSIQWGAQIGSYSPDFGNTSLYRYVDANNQLKVSPKARFNFNQSAINSIKDYYNNYGYYYTFDISLDNENNTSMDAYFYFYSDLPNPKFDIDDDPELWGGNGYNDETEVVSLSPTSMQANTDYRFESYFRVLNENVKPYFVFTSQESEYSWITGEYNVAEHNGISLFNEHLRRVYPW